MCLEPTVRAAQLLALQAKNEPKVFAMQAASAAAPFAAYQAGKKEPSTPATGKDQSGPPRTSLAIQTGTTASPDWPDSDLADLEGLLTNMKRREAEWQAATPAERKRRGLVRPGTGLRIE